MSKLDQGLKERQKITKTQQKEIRDLYQKASDNLKKKIEALEFKGGSYSLQKAELDKLVKELKRKMEEIGLESQNLIENGISSTVESTVKDAKGLLSSWGLSIEGAYSSVPSKVIESLITGKVYKGNWSLSGAIWEDIGKTQKDITRIVSLGLAENKTIYEIAKDLEKYVNPSAKKDWDWSKVYPGTKKVVDYNAQRLARTLINHAYQRTMVVTSLNNPFIKGLKWETSNAHGRICDLCMERANSDEYGLGSGVFPVDKVPLDHPNGMCILTRVLLDSSDRVNRLANWAKGGSDPELDKWYKSMMGKSPEKVTKKTKTKSKEEEIEVKKEEIPEPSRREESNTLLDFRKAYSDMVGDMGRAQIKNALLGAGVSQEEISSQPFEQLESKLIDLLVNQRN